MSGRNRIPLMVYLNGEFGRSNFSLHEFESRDGTVVVHSLLLQGLQLIRNELGRLYDANVPIIVNSGTRSEADNIELAGRLGWIDEGGVVSKDSKHLPKWGGIAADIRSGRMTTTRMLGLDLSEAFVVPVAKIGEVARTIFPYVNDSYRNHVHVDCLDRQTGRVELLC